MAARKVIPFRLSAPHALRLIREIAVDSDRVLILPHATRRMIERQISRRDVDRCLLRGIITEGPALDQRGNWRCTMTRRTAGEETTLAVAIEMSSRLIVITVF